MTISNHIKKIHYDHFIPYADRHIMTISYYMQIDTLLPFRTICRSTHYDHFVPYAKSYEDGTFILILHHIQINFIPKYMLHVGTVKSMYLRRGEKEKKYTCIYILLILLNVQ
jgi:hypothetical protein